MTILNGPRGATRDRLGPFVQRFWQRTFVWVAVVGVGYLTVPEDNFDPFVALVNRDNPDFDGAARLLERAAIADGDKDRTRFPMPADADYRARLAAPVQPVNAEACTLESFVERKWNRPFVWVLIPKTGNVTVPEDKYDRFYDLVSAQPPNYPAACALLVEAAAADTVVTASPVGPVQLASREACTFEPFVERKWNRPFVWVLIPKTGNVTVPEDNYDRFYRLISSDPPDYPAACAVLAEAAAADSVVIASNAN
jgi:hypothetical protein